METFAGLCHRCASLDRRPIPRVDPGANRVLERFGWRGRKIALYAGNLGAGHLFNEFISAARWFHDQGRTDWIFAFVGRGSRRAALEQQTASVPNVRTLDYLPESEIADLLWSATVHLISMRPGWEGVIVPSKLYGALQTGAPILFVGPSDADTAVEISRLNCGRCLAAGASGAAVAGALDELAAQPRRLEPSLDPSGPQAVAAFVTS